MKTIPIALTEMSDHELLCEVKPLAEDEREATCKLVASLIELTRGACTSARGTPHSLLQARAIVCRSLRPGTTLSQAGLAPTAVLG
jgi:hypothetical protein